MHTWFWWLFFLSLECPVWSASSRSHALFWDASWNPFPWWLLGLVFSKGLLLLFWSASRWFSRYDYVARIDSSLVIGIFRGFSFVNIRLFLSFISDVMNNLTIAGILKLWGKELNKEDWRHKTSIANNHFQEKMDYAANPNASTSRPKVIVGRAMESSIPRSASCLTFVDGRKVQRNAN